MSRFVADGVGLGMLYGLVSPGLGGIEPLRESAVFGPVTWLVPQYWVIRCFNGLHWYPEAGITLFLGVIIGGVLGGLIAWVIHSRH